MPWIPRGWCLPEPFSGAQWVDTEQWPQVAGFPEAAGRAGYVVHRHYAISPTVLGYGAVLAPKDWAEMQNEGPSHASPLVQAPSMI